MKDRKIRWRWIWILGALKEHVGRKIFDARVRKCGFTVRLEIIVHF